MSSATNAPLWWGVLITGRLCGCAGTGLMEILVPSSQFFCKLVTVLKKTKSWKTGTTPNHGIENVFCSWSSQFLGQQDFVAASRSSAGGVLAQAPPLTVQVVPRAVALPSRLHSSPVMTWFSSFPSESVSSQYLCGVPSFCFYLQELLSVVCS